MLLLPQKWNITCNNHNIFKIFFCFFQYVIAFGMAMGAVEAYNIYATCWSAILSLISLVMPNAGPPTNDASKESLPSIRVIMNPVKSL